MKKQIVLTIITTLFFGFQAFAADNAAKPMDPKMQEMMKKYQEASTPGEAHKILADLAGTWKVESKSWQTPKAKPETSNGEATFKMILGGRWLQQEFKGEAMGMPYEGLGLIGYDNVKGKYETHWLDSMMTGSVNTEGTYDAKTKTLKDKGQASCPISPSKVQEVRTEWKMVSKNKTVFSLFGTEPQGGPEFKMLEMIYTR